MNKTARILLVDDSEIVRSFLKKSLKQMGLDNYVESDNGWDAFAKIKAAQNEGKEFDIVIIDWSMPMMKGIDVVKKCKASENLKNVRFIMISAEQDRDNILAALDAGVSDYITKPFSPADLTSKLQKLLTVTKAA